MKKLMVLLLVFVAGFSLMTACGSSGEDAGTEEADAVADAGNNDSEDVVLTDLETLSFATAAEDTEAAGFIALVNVGGECCYEIGVDDYEELCLAFGVDEADCAKIFVAIENEEKYPYLYPEEGEWSGYVTADSDAELLTEAAVANVVDAFNEWRSTVYSLFDYQTIRVETPDKYYEAAPDEDYEPTEEDYDLLKSYVSYLNGYSFIGDRNTQDVNDILAAYLGDSVGNEAYDYLYNQVTEKIKNKSNVGTLLRNMGVTNDGGYQGGFGDAMIATYFSESWFAGYEAQMEIIQEFMDKGVCMSSASDLVWRLHPMDEQRVILEVDYNDAGYDHAFAVIVTEDGDVYWKIGLDDCSYIREEYGVTENYVDLQMYPVLDTSAAEYSLPDGLNPSVTRYFAYYEPNAVTWTLQVRGGGDMPDWFTSDMEAAVNAAFDEWYAEVYSHVDFETASALFPAEYEEIQEVTEEDIEILREYASLVREYEAQGVIVDVAVEDCIAEAIGTTQVTEMEAWLKAKWRTIHTDCPAPCISIGYCLYHGIVSTENTDTNTCETTLLCCMFSDISWSFSDTPEEYPFAMILTLFQKGLVPYDDGENWYIASGADCTVIYCISEAELLG